MTTDERAGFIRSRLRRLLCALAMCGPHYEHVGGNLYRCRLCGGESHGQGADWPMEVM